MISPGGHLFLGHSERVDAASGLGFRAVGSTIYRLMDGAGSAAVGG
jgi:chemotaxis methyl-accepting protein methylase